MSNPSNCAFVTLLLNDDYLPGTLTLIESLKEQKTNYPVILLYSQSNLSKEILTLLKLSKFFKELINIDDNLLYSNSINNLNLVLKRPDLKLTLTKLNIWKLVDYKTLVYLDSDLLVLKNIDSLFTSSVTENLQYDQILASPDCGWPDLFNSGLFIMKPSLEIYSKLIAFYNNCESFDGADQGLLNEFFTLQNKWVRLPFTYNCTLSSNYEYFPALKKFIDDVKAIHFIGNSKPWRNSHSNNNEETSFKLDFKDKGYLSLHQLWWTFFKNVNFNTTNLDHYDILRLAGTIQPAPKHVSPIPTLPTVPTVSTRQEEPEIVPPSATEIPEPATPHHHTYYYKHPSSLPEQTPKDKGEAYKLNEPRTPNKWQDNQTLNKLQVTQAPSKRQDTQTSKNSKNNDQPVPVEELSQQERYVKSHPIFPWEKRENSPDFKKASRSFDNIYFSPSIPTFERPKRKLKRLPSSLPQPSVEDAPEPLQEGQGPQSGKFIAGFDDPSEFNQFLQKMESMERRGTATGIDSKDSEKEDKKEDDIGRLLNEKLTGIKIDEDQEEKDA